ncbi:InlB B-repeat-containing protein, partial [Hungatella hathewayi]|uniref:InlB B-repeat-containing protein n=1 Tax=Hungatella hathewayi TaxID=154046 RepID=UPI003219BF30
MKGLRRKFRRGLAGFLAFVLTMTSFNMVSWADVASAFETEKATFVMSGEEIRESAQAAIDSGNEFSFEDLGADASDRSLAKEYQRLFGAGTVFEFSPSYDMDEEEYADGAELRMFIRVDDAYEGYQITGDEDIIFLYINDSSARITFRSQIDGYTTQKVTVKGNSSLLDDNEAAVPGGEPQLPAGEEETNSDGAIETPDTNGETNLEEETEASEPGKESESEEAIETPDTNEESESAEAIETSAADTETGETNENPDANAESNEDHSIQSPDPNTNAEENLNTETETDKSNEVQTPDENVSEDNQEPADHAAVEPASEGDSNIDTTTDENTAAPSSDNSSDVEALSDDAGQLSVSRHSSYVLTTAITVIEENDSNDKAFDDDKNNKAAEVPADNQEKAEEFQNKETDPVEATDGEVNEETTIAAPVETESSNDAVSDEEEQTSVSSEEMIQVDNSIDNPAEKTEDNSENLSDEKESTVTVETSAEAEEQEEEKAVTGSTSGKTYGQIVLDESYYAKAYVTTLNKLHVDVSSEGYAVTYTVTPVGTATIKGAKNVAEGNDLSFTVKPQVGYVIDRVTANGEELEAVDDSEATDSNASLSAKRYIVPSVTEEQEIMISMSETGEHPEFSFSKTLGNVVVSLHAEEGILPAGTLAKVTEVTEKVQEAVKEKTAEETGEDTSENTVLAYDIKLFVENGEGELEALDNSWSENGYVDVTFSGRAIEEKSAEAETVEVEHIDTGNLDISSESVNKVAANEVKNIETVSDIIHVAGENTVAEISFEAAHFSVYMVTFKGINSPTLRFDLNNGKGTVPQPISAKAGELVTLPGQGNLYRDNYVLLGWSTSKDSSAVSKTSVSSYAGYVPLGSSYQMPWSSTTLYAVWAQNSGVKSGYLSIAIRNDGTIPGEPSVQYAGYAYLCENKKVDNLLYYFNPLHTVAGVEEVSNALTPEFYEEVERLNESKRLWNSNEYVEWYVIKDQRNDIKYPEGVWHIDGVVQKKISVSLNYNRNETPTGEDYGVVPDGQSYSKGQTAVIAGNGSLKWPGFTFDGWDTKKDGSGKRYYEKDKIKMESNVTLYAQWQPNGAVKLTYDKDAADATEVLPSKIEFVQGGQSLKDKQKIIGSTSRPGYSFGGWYTEKNGSGNLFTVETPIETNMTVYAKWIPNDEVTLTYDKAAEDAAAVLPNTTETVLRGQSLAYAGRDIGITSRPGYKFGGWYTGKNGTGVPFDETVAIKENMTVYAKWTANAKVTLTYDKAAEDAAEVQPSAAETVLSGQSLANAGKELGITSRPGYTFGGWYTAENGTGQRFDTAYVIEESMTVYAKWTANANVTLTYDKAAEDAAAVLPNAAETVLSGQSLANAGKDLGRT